MPWWGIVLLCVVVPVYAAFAVGVYARMWHWISLKAFNGRPSSDDKFGVFVGSLVSGVLWPVTLLSFWTYAIVYRMLPREFRG